jgi:hypothetical protein
MTAFEKVIVVGKVRTVSTGAKQEAIPAGLQYSVIGQLVEVKKERQSLPRRLKMICAAFAERTRDCGRRSSF